jgi:DNA processing protein
MRKVFAVPGSPFDERAGGTNYLLKQGAALLESAQDIISYLNSLENYMFEANASYTAPANTGLPPESELAQYRKQLQQALSYTPVSMDLILTETGIPYTILNVLVLELELAGRVTRSFGNKICLINTNN